jgi:DeoR family transcriptional regulator, fructose operon transcriptional repressor
MLADDRRRWLVEAIRRTGSLKTSDAEKALKVSRMTIHRDLDLLAAQGLLRKTHGGAISVDRDMFDPRARPFAERLSVASAAKRRIASHVVGTVQGSRTLVLDASSTVYYVAEALAREKWPEDPFIVTGSLQQFSELVRHRGRGVACHGGEAHQLTGTLVGPMALAGLGDLRFDWAIVSAMGAVLEDDAAFDSSPEEVAVKRAYLERARHKLLAIDSSKIGLSGAYKLATLTDFDVIVVETGAHVLRGNRLERLRPARRA